ncbi:protease complex subunit PrcB family protein [Thioalkalivibrio sp.]|uniref:protease complex subunit PrcB family protein n=1 Tax=Thioalkalivibrio sp. TaxID=2093813 RepID=UPI003975B2D6
MRTIPILVLASLSVACMGPVPSEELPMTRLAKGQHSLQTEQKFEVITGQSQFRELWSRFDSGSPPVLDFTRQTAIAVFMGERPTGGYAIQVDSVTRSDGELLVEVVLQAPGPECMTTQAFTQPYEMVSVPTGPTRADFSTRRVLIPCE